MVTNKKMFWHSQNLGKHDECNSSYTWLGCIIRKNIDRCAVPRESEDALEVPFKEKDAEAQVQFCLKHWTGSCSFEGTQHFAASGEVNASATQSSRFSPEVAVGIPATLVSAEICIIRPKVSISSSAPADFWDRLATRHSLGTMPILYTYLYVATNQMHRCFLSDYMLLKTGIYPECLSPNSFLYSFQPWKEFKHTNIRRIFAFVIFAFMKDSGWQRCKIVPLEGDRSPPHIFLLQPPKTRNN